MKHLTLFLSIHDVYVKHLTLFLSIHHVYVKHLTLFLFIHDVYVKHLTLFLSIHDVYVCIIYTWHRIHTSCVQTICYSVNLSLLFVQTNLNRTYSNINITHPTEYYSCVTLTGGNREMLHLTFKYIREHGHNHRLSTCDITN